MAASSKKWVLGVIALAVLVPLLQPVEVAPDYRLFLVSTMIIAAIAVLGLNLLTGFNGQFSSASAPSTRWAPTPPPS